MFENTVISYSVLTILSTGKRSFENLGRLINKSGDTIRRMLNPAEISLTTMQKIAQTIFCDSKIIYLAVDDTLIKKIYSRFMVGSGWFFDTKTRRMINAYKLIAAMISDEKHTIPISCGFMFAQEVLSKTDHVQSKLEFVKLFFELTQKLFPNKKIIIIADGLFSTKEILQWCFREGINCEMRMHSNRVVNYNGRNSSLSMIKSLELSGRRMARTINAIWHDIPLYITAEKRIDKHGNESIVYLVSTHKAKPSEHVKIYKKRWPIEKVFRTTKQYLGLQECFSTKMQTQFDHVCNVFLTYALVQCEMKKKGFNTPEECIKALKRKKYQNILHRLSRLDQIFGDVYA
jgi:GAF domain-containing protein